MTRHSHDIRFSTPAVERARQKAEERMRALRDGGTGRVSGDRVDLAVLVDELGDSPLEIKETLPRGWVHALLDDKLEIHWGANGDASVDVQLFRESAFVRLKGKAFFRLVHPCVRCGQRDVPFEWNLKLDLRLVERAPDTEINADFEAHDDGDDHAGSPLGDAADLEDLDIASYVGDSVDVGAVIREQLFLELPHHPNCESPGSVLGEPCAFAEQQKKLDEERANWIDPRWGPLLALKPTLPVAAPPEPETKKPEAKKPEAKKPDAKKPEPKKPEPKKPEAQTTTAAAAAATPVTPVTAPVPVAPTAAKKTPAKKAAAKKTAAKKTPAKKTAAKKTAAKKTKTAAKKTAKKTPAKKTAKKTPAKKTAKKTPAKKTAKKKTR